MNISDHEGIRDFLAYLQLPLVWSTDSKDHGFSNGFNVTPGSPLKVLYSADHEIREEIMQWGIKPSWKSTKQNKLPSMLMYARAETIWQKKSFATLMIGQRIVIPVNGFYEWRREKKIKQPYYFCASDSQPYFLAGVFTITTDNQFQCCVVTNTAGKLMSPVHDRSPVIISPDLLEDWLLSDDRDLLNRILHNDNELLMQSIQVSSYVNSALHEGKVCIQPIVAGAEPTQSELF